MATAHAENSRYRYPVLDLLRIFAAMWVAIYHLTGGHGWFSYLKHPYGNILAEGKLGFISPFVRLGFLGVPIFFVISGYVIVTSSENKSVAEFFSDRMARLFPSFLMSIVVVCSVFSYGFRAPYNLTFVKFFSSLSLSWYTFPEAKIQGSYWTLWPELRFYGLFLVFVLIFKKRISYKHKVFYFFVGMLAITYFTYGNNSSFGIIGLGDYGVYFILGGFIGATANLRILKATWIFILGTLCFVAINLRTWIIAWDPGHPNEWRFGEGLFLIAVITTAVARRLEFANHNIREVLSLLGRSSYAFYLLQEGLGMPTASFLVSRGMQIRYSVLIALVVVSFTSILFTATLERSIARRIKSGFLTGVDSLRSDELRDVKGVKKSLKTLNK